MNSASIDDQWWLPPSSNAPFLSIADLRMSALTEIKQRPNLCLWQDRAGPNRHVTVYCLLTDKLDQLELALEDSRFDELVIEELCTEQGRELLYLYETFALHAEQLLRELDHLPQLGKRSRDKVTGHIDHYVNTMVKHRAERHKNKHNPYDHDHHAALSYADFVANPSSPGISPDGSTWGVPSLAAAARHIASRVADFDKTLADDETRTSVERGRSAALGTFSEIF